MFPAECSSSPRLYGVIANITFYSVYAGPMPLALLKVLFFNIVTEVFVPRDEVGGVAKTIVLAGITPTIKTATNIIATTRLIIYLVFIFA